MLYIYIMKKCRTCLDKLSEDSFLISKYKSNGEPIRRLDCRKCHSKKVNSKKKKKILCTVTDLEGEVWCSIKNYENVYAVSNLGRVKSLAREIDDKNYFTKRKVGEKILKSFLLNSGYLKVNLKVSGYTNNQLVHRLVALAFIDNPDDKEQVNHKNGVKTDNRINNLEWVSRSENTKHAIQTGLIQQPEKNLWRNCR